MEGNMTSLAIINEIRNRSHLSLIISNQTTHSLPSLNKKKKKKKSLDITQQQQQQSLIVYEDIIGVDDKSDDSKLHQKSPLPC